MKVILGLLLFTAVSGSSALLGAKKCLYGPAYWCESYKNAKLCGTLDNCMKNSWKNKFAPKEFEECASCKSQIIEARNIIKSKDFTKILHLMIEGVCYTFLKVKYYQIECKTDLNSYIPEILDYLNFELQNPTQACFEIGLCKTFSINDLVLKQTKKLLRKKMTENSGTTCKKCREYTSYMKNFTQSIQKQEILHSMYKNCKKINSDSTGCNIMEKNNFDTVYGIFFSKMNLEDVCLEACFSQNIQDKNNKFENKYTSTERNCVVCQSVFEHLKFFLENGHISEEEFKQALEDECKRTGHFDRDCKAYVDENYREFYETLISVNGPLNLCKKMEYCEASVLKKVFSLKSFKNEISRITSNGKSNPNGLFKKNEPNASRSSFQSKNFGETVNESNFISRVLKRFGSSKCVICEFTIHFLQNLLEENASRKEMKEGLETICNVFPRPIDSHCQEYVDTYGTQIIEMLISEVNPSTICPTLHMCPGFIEHSLVKVARSITCDLCIFAESEIMNVIKIEKSTIRRALTDSCRLLPDIGNTECQTFVDVSMRYVDHIILFLEDNGLCIHAGACHPWF